MATLPSPLEVSLPGRLLARTGLSAQIPGAGLRLGEMAFTTDDARFWVGDESQTPPWILTSKTTGNVDLSRINPTFNNINLNTINGQTIAALILANGGVSSGGSNNSGGSSGDISTEVTAKGIPTRYRSSTNNVRTVCGGSGAYNWITAISGISITKFGPATGTGATDVIIFMQPSAYGGNTQGVAGPTIQRITDGNGHSDDCGFSCNFYLNGIGAIALTTTPIFRITGIPSGVSNLLYQWSRLDNTSWYGICNPDGPDYSGSGTHTGIGTTSRFTMYEVPTSV